MRAQVAAASAQPTSAAWSRIVWRTYSTGAYPLMKASLMMRKGVPLIPSW